MKKTFPAVLFVCFVIFTGCDRVDFWGDLSSSVTAVATPPGGAWLSGTTSSINSDIVVTFNTSMDTASLAFTGTMASASNTAWSATTETDDTLTISAATDRTRENGATLTINCNSVEGDSTTLNLTYNVTGSLYYVNSTNPGTTLTGTRDDPMTDIQTAVTAASPAAPGVVLVASGTYDNSSTLDTLVTMAEGVSLYGGYSPADWRTRNSATYISLLEDTRTSLGSSTPIAPQKLISVPSAITSATVIDGFTIRIAPFVSGPSNPSAAGVLIDNASPVISNNIFTSFNVSGGSYSGTFGISHLNGGTPEIFNNTFSLGTRDNTALNSSNYGIYCYNNANANIHDNIIDPGTSSAATGATYGIYIIDSSPTISNNSSIRGGSGGSSSTAIYITSTSGSISTPTINDNTITAGESDDSCTIDINGTDASGNSQPNITNNLIEGGTTGTDATGIRISTFSSGLIQNNRIIVSGATTSARAISINNAAPLIRENYIQGGDTGTATYGIQIQGTSDDLYIYNNAINAGGGTSTSYGINIFDAGVNPVNGELSILNNTINGRRGTFAAAIRLATTISLANPIDISNNNLFTDMNSGSRYGIYEGTANAFPSDLFNNNFFNCAVLYFNYIDGTTDQSLVSTSELDTFYPDGSNIAAMNISENIYTYLSSSNEYRFTGDPASFTFDTAGMDGNAAGWGFTIDRDTITRTEGNGWSIGAYEYD